MDIFEKCHEFTAAKVAMEMGIYPYFIPITENEGSEAVFQGLQVRILHGSYQVLSDG